MKFTTGLAIAVLSAMPMGLAAVMPSKSENGAPAIVRRETTCTAHVVGSNSEGGGGPGQSSVNNNGWQASVMGPTGDSDVFCSETGTDDGAGEISCPTISASAYGGTYDTTCTGLWEFDNNSWDSCSCNQVPGAVQPDTISSGTVSVTTDVCIVVYDC